MSKEKSVGISAKQWEYALSLLDETKRLLEYSDPPKGGYTRSVIGRVKRFLTRNNWK